MPTVDSKGRIVLPKDVRESLGIDEGTEVEIHEKGGKAVVEPEKHPEVVIDRMESLIEEASANRETTTTRETEMDPFVQKHADAIRRGAASREAGDE